MTTSTKTGTQSVEAKHWLKPDQVEQLRTATVRESPTYLAQRNDAIIAVLYDAGLRIDELVQLDVEMLDLNEGYIGLPADVQKDYPTDNSPSYTEIELADETVRTLQNWLNTRWKDTTALFPSRQSPRISTDAVRESVVKKAAVDADVRPMSTGRGRGDPEDVTPHVLRHSVAYRMLAVEDGNELYDVTRRLRHATIQTTERVYAHFDRV